MSYGSISLSLSLSLSLWQMYTLRNGYNAQCDHLANFASYSHSHTFIYGMVWFFW